MDPGSPSRGLGPGHIQRAGKKGPDPPSAGQSPVGPPVVSSPLCRLLSQESLRQIHHPCLVTTQPVPWCPFEKVGSPARPSHTGPVEQWGKFTLWSLGAGQAHLETSADISSPYSTAPWQRLDRQTARASQGTQKHRSSSLPVNRASQQWHLLAG